ncbi:ATP-binding protein [Ekhidna sp.]|uniref:ATP-binding protein n=1 Tax=Ekhidna sp. TaxID=2608089 RepID=UPI003BA934E7
MRIKHILPATDRSIQIEKRLFETTLALTVLVFLFWSIYGFIIGYDLFIQSIYTGGVFIYSTLYFILKRSNTFRAISITYYYLILFLIGISWFPSGGIKAAIPTFLALVYLSGLLVLPLRDYLAFIIVTFGLVLGLTIYEINNPELAATYENAELLMQDLTIATLSSLVIMGICLYIFKRTFIDDRRELRKRNKELESEKRNAESTDRAKSTFLATISHEMRTPLNGIVGMTELLSNTNLDKEQRELIESLGYSSNILHGLISNVLDLTIIEAGKLQLTKNSFSSTDELNAIWKIFEKRAGNNPNLEIKLDVDPKLPQYLKGDISRIRQVLINLLNNAVKFTWKGSITLRVEVVGQTGDVISVRFSVQDTGAGIAEEKQPYLFETFYKASDRDGYEGSGLGLTIVQRLVSLMGGHVQFESEPKKGSNFYFTLPLGIAHEDDLASFDKIEVPGMDELKVLIVEDIEINRLVANKILKTLNISNVDLAINGTEGVEKATSKFYDIIFMDLQMPDISGFEASKRISEHYKGELHKPVIIALTANALKKSKEECLAVGMSDYLLKPIKSETIKQVLMKYLNK